MKIQVPVLLVSTSIITACWPPFYDSSPSRASPTFVSELNVHGATYLARHVNPTFQSPACSEDGLYIGNLEGSQFYFSPPLDYSNSDQINELISSENQGIDVIDQNFWKPFTYKFSTADGAEFNEITGTSQSFTDLSNQFGDTEVPNTYSNSVLVVQTANGPRPEFLLFGNYYLLAFQSSIPVNATHIELWFNVSRESDTELVHRVALENFHSWRSYVEPHINTNQAIYFCDA